MWNNHYTCRIDEEMKSELKYIKHLESHMTQSMYPKHSYYMTTNHLYIFASCIFTITSFEFSEILVLFNLYPPIAKILFLISPGPKFGD